MLGYALYRRYVGMKHTHTHITSSKLVQSVQNICSMYACMHACVRLSPVCMQYVLLHLPSNNKTALCSLDILLSSLSALCPSSKLTPIEFSSLALSLCAIHFLALSWNSSYSLCHAKSVISVRVLHRNWRREWKSERKVSENDSKNGTKRTE